MSETSNWITEQLELIKQESDKWPEWKKREASTGRWRTPQERGEPATFALANDPKNSPNPSAKV